MSTEAGSGKELLRSEFIRRIREAVTLRDWIALENCAKQWILFEPNAGAGFKWLARASVALNKPKRAAYSYGRLLDFEAGNEEAQKFFADYPSILADQPSSVRKAAESARPTPPLEPEFLVTPEQRRLLASQELDLAQNYEKFMLHAEASARFKKSFEWQPSQASALGAARALHRSNRSLDAVRFMREQINKFPDWVEGRLLLARVHFDMGQKAESQTEWQAILKIDPNNREALSFLRSLYSSKI